MESSTHTINENRGVISLRKLADLKYLTFVVKLPNHYSFLKWFRTFWNHMVILDSSFCASGYINLVLSDMHHVISTNKKAFASNSFESISFFMVYLLMRYC